jgi:hypothetical protein
VKQEAESRRQEAARKAVMRDGWQTLRISELESEARATKAFPPCARRSRLWFESQSKQPSRGHLRLQFYRVNQLGFVNQGAIDLCANRAAKRNLKRFPSDFMFQLTAEESAALRYQVGL